MCIKYNLLKFKTIFILIFRRIFQKKSSKLKKISFQTFDTRKLSLDSHCYECKVKYRDPRPRDLVMFLHAWTYSVTITVILGTKTNHDSIMQIPLYSPTFVQRPPLHLKKVVINRALHSGLF